MTQNLRFSLIYLATALMAVAALKFLTGSAISTAFVILSGLMSYFLVFGLIFVNEQYEEKHHGYIFLCTLPLSVREIVMAKFLRVLFAELLLAGMSVLWISLSPALGEQIVVARSWILFNALLALALGGLAQIGLFSTSYTTFLKISLVFLIFLQIMPLLLMSSGKAGQFIEGTIDFLSSINWVVLIPVGFAVYFVILLAAVKVKTLNRC